MSRSNRQRTLIVALLGALLGFGLVAAYMSGNRQNRAAPQTNAATADSPAPVPTQATTTNANETAQTNAQPPTSQTKDGGGGSNSVMTTIFGGDEASATHSTFVHWTVLVPRIILRLALPALLVAGLAFRPRRGALAVQRNPYVAQTQILLAVVASALMMIVGDSAARAFGIFAAASLVRFRTNIRDPKEITVLLVSLAIGLAMGVGRWELAIILTLFVFLLLWVLEYYELNQVVRSMQVTVKSRDTATTQETLKRIFRRHRFDPEVRQFEPSTEQEPVGCIVYSLSMNLGVSTDELSEEIIASDPE
ncbi:MAG TPA: DUF4956 domain-containing protein, partial [Pyrinomonadaceae bacterium]|nr:DUF4956 domain-containing protein [Pyrinomonadaceae bacterium]